MKLESSIRLNAPREQAWAALNDVDVLRSCITGCESLTRTADGNLEAVLTAKVGPVSARFAGTVKLLDVAAPEAYRLVFSGQGGAAGFARGEARVRLVEYSAVVTELQYSTQATVGGKLAQVGSRLVESSARKLADDFFSRFGQALESAARPQAQDGQAQPVQQQAGTAVTGGAKRFKWAIAAAVLATIALAIYAFALL